MPVITSNAAAIDLPSGVPDADFISFTRCLPSVESRAPHLLWLAATHGKEQIRQRIDLGAELKRKTLPPIAPEPEEATHFLIIG